MQNKLFDLISNNTASFIISEGDTVIYQDIGIGVKPIMRVIREKPSLLQNAVVIDKVIGKAAALLLTKYSVSVVYGLLMSKTAIKIFEKNNIEYHYIDLVDTIKNRTGDALCPLEDCVKDTDDPDIGFVCIQERIKLLMKG